ncbi:predicted protein, partial [Naegleria gruberi]
MNIIYPHHHHKVSLVLVMLLVVSMLMMNQQQQVRAAELTSSEKTAILNAHNSARLSVAPTPLNKLAALEWSDELASRAASWLTKCAAGPSSNSLNLGVNIHVSMKGNMSVVDIVNEWTLESSKYDFTNNYCSSGDCQHYIQVVSAASTKVGCSRATCAKVFNKPELNGATLIVCNYSPKPNVLDRPY